MCDGLIINVISQPGKKFVIQAALQFLRRTWINTEGFFRETPGCIAVNAYRTILGKTQFAARFEELHVHRTLPFFTVLFIVSILLQEGVVQFWLEKVIVILTHNINTVIIIKKMLGICSKGYNWQ